MKSKLSPFKKFLKHLAIVILFLTLPTGFAQNSTKASDMVENSVAVNSSLDEAWLVLADFAGVGNFHVLYEESRPINGTPALASIGAERESLMPNGNYNTILKERIVNLVEGSQYTYEVYDSENTSLETMQVTYGVRTGVDGRVVIYSRMSYEMGSLVQNNLVKRKFNRDNRNSLLSYKYYIETGETEKDLKKLKKWFKENEKSLTTDDFLATNTVLIE